MPKRERETREHPVFGTLKLDDSGDWTVLLHLPVFAHYDDKSYAVHGDIDDEAGEQPRQTRKQKRRAEQFAAGLFPLHIVDAEENGPTVAQEEAYRFLVDHESEVVDAIMSYVFRVYAGMHDYWTLEGLQQHDPGFELSAPGDLTELMRLSAVTIMPADDDVAAISFYFSSTLDEEHGVEVTTHRTDVEDDFSDVFPFDLPARLDANDIEPEPAGHRLVDFKHRGKWRGIYVLDEGLQCVGSVATSFNAHAYYDLVTTADEIEDIRPASARHRWSASAARKSAAGWLTASNWLVSLPCLLIAWAFMPQLFCVSIGLSVLCLVGIWLLEGVWRLMPIVQIAASIVGLYYASNSADFGSQEHVTDVVGVYGSIVWWCVVPIDAFAIMLVVMFVATYHRDLIREGLGGVLPALLLAVPLTSGLVASHYGYWSAFHLVWLTPLAIVASLALLIVGISTDVLDFSKRCPKCGEPLRTSRAQQCLECGADWHRS